MKASAEPKPCFEPREASAVRTGPWMGERERETSAKVSLSFIS